MNRSLPPSHYAKHLAIDLVENGDEPEKKGGAVRSRLVLDPEAFDEMGLIDLEKVFNPLGFVQIGNTRYEGYVDQLEHAMPYMRKSVWIYPDGPATEINDVAKAHPYTVSSVGPTQTVLERDEIRKLGGPIPDIPIRCSPDQLER